jgi:hypothetical protein
LPLTLVACAARTQPSADARDFTAFAVDQTGGGAGTVQITVNRWSTDGERQRLIGILQEKGPDALIDALRDIPSIGTIRTPDSLGYPLHYAHREPLPEGGEKIVIATDRPISFWEQVNQPRSIDYPFTVIQMQMNPDGVGEGRLLAAARIIAHDNIIEVENYAIQPVVLQQVRSENAR